MVSIEEIGEKYDRIISLARDRIQTAREFREPDRVPVVISTAGSYFAWMLGFPIEDYYINADMQVEASVKSMLWHLEELEDDAVGTDIGGFDFGPLAEGLYFDCPVERPAGTSPRIVPIIKDEDDIKKFRPPKPGNSRGLVWADKKFEEFRKAAAAKGVTVNAPGPSISIHPPLSAACAVMEPEKVYMLMAEKPASARHLFDIMFESFCLLKDHYDSRYGRKSGSLSMANDNTCFISNSMYVDQVLEYDLALYEKYGREWRFMHTDGPSDHNFRTFADVLKLDMMDIGGFSSIDSACEAMKGRVVIHGGLNCRDVYGEFSEETKRKIDHAIKVAAPGGGFEFAIGGETYVGANPATLKEMVAYVKERGRYPLHF